MKKGNAAKGKYLANLDVIAEILIQLEKDIKGHTVFSFRYFDNSQEHGPDFSHLNEVVLKKLVDKLKHFSRETLQKWKQEPAGKGKGHILEVYGDFPANSLFRKPSFAPEGVKWGRFRIEWDFRLAGFILEDSMCESFKISRNTFFVVFLDPNHKFCPGS